MELARLVALAPLAYIIAWIYGLFFWVIPTWNIPAEQTVNVTIWGVIGTIQFFTVGIILLIICIVFFIKLMGVD